MKIILYAVPLYSNTSNPPERIEYLGHYPSIIRVHNTQYIVDIMTNLCENITDFELKDWTYNLAII